jgi:hypothetical protein
MGNAAPTDKGKTRCMPCHLSMPVQIRPCVWVCLFMHERCDGRAPGGACRHVRRQRATLSTLERRLVGP